MGIHGRVSFKFHQFLVLIYGSKIFLEINIYMSVTIETILRLVYS